MFKRTPALTARFDHAFLYAHRLHNRQVRKGLPVPYLSHLLGVASLVLEDGGDEDEAIAALLHDAVEDQGGLATLEDIRQLFGVRVADLVLSLSDSTGKPRPPWRERKEEYIQHLRLAEQSVLRVSLADKLQNARLIAVDLRRSGKRTWYRFNGGKDGTLWYYHALVETFRECYRSPFVIELELTVNEIEQLQAEIEAA